MAHLLSLACYPGVEQGDEGHLDGRQVEHVEFEPTHGHQSCVIKQNGVDIDVARHRGQHLPEIDERTDYERISGKREGRGVDVERAEEGAHVGIGDTGVPVDGIDGRDGLVAVDGIPDVDEGSYDVREIIAIRNTLVEIVAPAEGAAGEVMHEVARNKLHEAHIGLAIVTQQGDDHVDEVEHEDGACNDAQCQRQAEVYLACVELHHEGRDHRDDDGTFHHITELDDQHEYDKAPEQEIGSLDVIEGEDKDRDDHTSEMRPDTMTAELLGKVLGAEEIETMRECLVKLQQEHTRQKGAKHKERLGKAPLLVFDGRIDGQIVMPHEGGEAVAGKGE